MILIVIMKSVYSDYDSHCNNDSDGDYCDNDYLSRSKVGVCFCLAIYLCNTCQLELEPNESKEVRAKNDDNSNFTCFISYPQRDGFVYWNTKTKLTSPKYISRSI